MKKLLFCLAACAAIATPAMARRIEPGLWESAITRNDPTAASRRALPEKARAAMKAQGLDIDGATIKAKICLTKEITDSDKLPMLQPMKDCKVQKSSFTGRTMTTDAECTMRGVTSHSHSEITYDNPRHYYGSITSDTTRNGQPYHSSMTIEARYLSPDCGPVAATLR